MKPGIKLYDDDFLNQAMTGSGSSGIEPYFHMVTPFSLESGTCTDGATGLNPYGNYKLDYTDYKNYRWYSTESASSYTNKKNTNSSMFSRTTLEPGVYCIAPTTAGEAQTGEAVITININGTSSEYSSTYTAYTGVATSFTVYATLTITSVETLVMGYNSIFEVNNIGFSLYRIGEAPEIPETGKWDNSRVRPVGIARATLIDDGFFYNLSKYDFIQSDNSSIAYEIIGLEAPNRLYIESRATSYSYGDTIRKVTGTAPTSTKVASIDTTYNYLFVVNNSYWNSSQKLTLYNNRTGITTIKSYYYDNIEPGVIRYDLSDDDDFQAGDIIYTLAPGSLEL